MRLTTPLLAASVLILALATSGARAWSEHRAAAFLAAHGIPVVPSRLVDGPEQAAAAAEALGYPVVVKLAADGIILDPNVVSD